MKFITSFALGALMISVQFVNAQSQEGKVTEDIIKEVRNQLVNKKYVPANILKVLDQKAILLPPWDAMFSPEL